MSFFVFYKLERNMIQRLKILNIWEGVENQPLKGKQIKEKDLV